MNSNKNIIICVGRQLGSGGHIIAKALADRLGCKLYDRELLNLAARESGFSEKFFEQNDEKKGFFESLFDTHVPFMSDSAFSGTGLSQESLFQIQSDAIRKAADRESCVFVGRCAEYVLREHKNMVSVFVTADIDERVERVSERRDCTPDEARHYVETQESRRSSYYGYYTGKEWGHSASYDLCVNSSRLGLDATVEFIAGYVRRVLGIDG